MPLQNVTIPELPAELKELIRVESWTGLKALPRRGAEIGGLLTASDSKEQAATGLELVTSEYLYGPSYHLSPAGLEAFRKQVAITHAAGTKVLAYFRSCTGEPFAVNAYDEEVIRETIPGVNFVLIAKPLATGKAVLRWFARDRSGSWFPSEELFIDPPLYTAPQFEQQRERSPRQESVPPRDAGPLGAAPGPLDDLQPSARKSRAWVLPSLGGLGVGAAAVLFLLYAGKPSTRTRTADAAALPVAAPLTQTLPAHASALGLRVDREARDLRLRWNQALPELQSAKLGLLEVDDGAQTHLIFLKPQQIAEGSLVYTPGSENVSFRLVIDRSDSVELSESVSVGKASERSPELSAAKSSFVTPNLVKPANPETSIAKSIAGKKEVPDPVKPVAKPELASSQPVVVPAETSPAPPRRTDPAPLTTAVLPPPTAVSHEEERPTAAPTARLDAGSLPAPPRLPESQAVSLTPAENPAMSIRPLTAPPPQAADFIPPRPLRRMNPDLSNVPQSLVNASLEIRIQVRVDEAGRVVEAVEIGGKPANRFLSGMALAAARRWTFEPAKKEGRKVAADYNINFHFAPSSSGPRR